MIYFIEAVGANLVKIGYTERNPDERLKELQTGCPHKLRVVGMWDEPAIAERFHHEQWQHLRTTGEWFRIDEQMRGYLWWLEHGKRYTDRRADEVKSELCEPGSPISKLFDRIMHLEDTVNLYHSHLFPDEDDLADDGRVICSIETIERSLKHLAERVHEWTERSADHGRQLFYVEQSVTALQKQVSSMDDNHETGRSQFGDCRM